MLGRAKNDAIAEAGCTMLWPTGVLGEYRLQRWLAAVSCTGRARRRRGVKRHEDGASRSDRTAGRIGVLVINGAMPRRRLVSRLVGLL